VILGRPGSFVTGTPVASAARLVRLAQPSEVVVGERAAAATAGAFELQQRDGAYVLVGALAARHSPAQVARRRKHRRATALIGATLVAAALATGAFYSTRSTPLTVPPNSVGIIDPKTNKVVGYVPVGSTPDAIASGGQAVWAANTEDRTLSRIDPKTRTIVSTIPLDSTPTALAVGLGAVWVVHGLVGKLSRVDPQHDRVTGEFDAHASFGSVDSGVTVGGGDVWVVYRDSRGYRIDPSSLRVVDTVIAGTWPTAVAFRDGVLWTANLLYNRVSRFDPPLYDESATISVGRSPSGLAVGGDAVWVTNKADDTVSRIDPGNLSAGITISVGRAPVGIAYSDGAVWVANSGSGTVSRIDPRTNKVVATIRVGDSPRGIAVGPDGVWVTVQGRQPT
jgi:YVTN family beta-propeller protein